MCGIAGYYSSSGKFNKTLLEQATQSIYHRGPDAGGTFIQGSVGLGHRRLSIIDLSEGANQPMVSSDKRYIIVYNGEVYNFKEIAQEIIKQKPEIKFKTTSDTEIILEAFVLWGVEMINKMNGMFAIAIYDNEKQELFLIRDRLGIKPIYYYYNERDFFFASELKAIKSVLPLLELNYDAIPYFFHLGFIPEPYSIYKNVFKFPAGSYLRINNAGIEIKPYWQVQDKIKAETLDNEKEAKAQLKYLIESSVKYRLISDVPFGTFLSGGIDSSLVTAVAQSVSNTPVKTFSIGLEEEEYSESKYSEQVAKYLKTDHHSFKVSMNDALELIDEIEKIYDEPYADSSAFPTLIVSKLARKYVTMTLSGDGGDELFMGYGAHLWAQRLKHPLVSAFRYPIQFALQMGNNRSKRVANLFHSYSNKYLHSNILSQEQNLFYEKELSSIVGHSLNHQVSSLFPMKTEKRKLTAAELQSLFDLRVYLKDDLLVKVDRASMQHSLETRVPLLDYRIVEFSLNLNQSLKLRDKTAKYLLKEVLYEYVPAHFFNRPKKGFSIPMHQWLRKDIRTYAEKYINKEICERYGIVNWGYAQKLKKHFYQDGLDFYYNRLWTIICFHKFMEQNF